MRTTVMVRMKYTALRHVQGCPHSEGGGPVHQLLSAAAAGVRPAGAGSWALDQPAAGGRGHGPAPPAAARGGQQRADAGGTIELQTIHQFSQSYF